MKSSHFFRILHITILGFMFFTFKIYALETIDERVKKLTLEKISQIDEKLKQLQNLKDELSYLADNCHGDDRPNCPILDALSKK